VPPTNRQGGGSSKWWGGGEERSRERRRPATATHVADHRQQDDVELHKGAGEGGEAQGGASQAYGLKPRGEVTRTEDSVGEEDAAVAMGVAC
jgi:hypothetical protein